MEVFPSLYLKVKNHIKWYLVSTKQKKEDSSYKDALIDNKTLNAKAKSLGSKLPQDKTLRKILTLMILIPITQQESPLPMRTLAE
jgi:hypothetical protein